VFAVQTAAFLFARALNRTEDFRLASNLEGAGALDDLVFRYRLREDVWKTCFMQLKHRDNGGTIKRSSLTGMRGEFSLFNYFKSYCEIKKNAATNANLKQCGQFGDFEFIIYTNANMKSNSSLRENEKIKNNSPVQGGDSDPLNILSSRTDGRKYITFDETNDKDIFGFFEELSQWYKLITELGKDINLKIENFKSSFKSKEILEKLNSLKSNLNKDNVTSMIQEVSECDFTFFKEFLNKVKIFSGQPDEETLKGLIKKELQEACKASPSVVNFIYTKLEDGFYKWQKKRGNVV
jgi:hypothetical protein